MREFIHDILKAFSKYVQGYDAAIKNSTRPRLLILCAFVLVGHVSNAQADSTIAALENIPLKYISSIDQKVNKYSKQVLSKTEKTLTKLSRWEDKIKGLIEKASPETAEKLFGSGRQTFGTVLQRVREGKQPIEGSKARYDDYRDKLTTNLKYLSAHKDQFDQKMLKPLAATTQKLDQLSEQVDDNEALQQFIKERKKELISTAVQYIGKSKYLEKINKEAWYYMESIRNYKAIFNDPKKAEETVKIILNRIPAFQQFVQKNSMLASIFGVPETIGTAASIAGLQTRTGVQSLMQQRISVGGPNAMQQIQQGIQQAQAELNNLKDKLMNPALGNGGGDLPDFKPNMEKSKSFKQRLEWGGNIQYSKNNALVPTTMDIALTIGYKLNDNLLTGIGAGYKMGIGSIRQVSITNQGGSVRSFIDMKLKRQFFVTGGFEINYLAVLPTSNDIAIQQTIGGNWQKSGLLGISKKINVKTKFFKGTKFQLLYDFLCNQHIPVSQPVLFRVGYNF